MSTSYVCLQVSLRRVTSTTRLLCLQVNVAVVLIQKACLYMDIQTSISKNVYINKAYPSYAKKKQRLHQYEIWRV